MRDLSMPGAPMSGAVVAALADMRGNDPVAYGAYRNKLADTMALVRLNWKVHELQEHLDESMLTNPELGEPEKEVIEARRERLRQELKRLVEQKEMAERHVLPVMESLLADHREKPAAGGGTRPAGAGGPGRPATTSGAARTAWVTATEGECGMGLADGVLGAGCRGCRGRRRTRRTATSRRGSCTGAWGRRR